MSTYAVSTSWARAAESTSRPGRSFTCRPLLDLIDGDYRRLFFFRANSRTIYSARWVLNRLAGLPEFKSWLTAVEPEIMEEWMENKKRVDRAADKATAIRNAMLKGDFQQERKDTKELREDRHQLTLDRRDDRREDRRDRRQHR